MQAGDNRVLQLLDDSAYEIHGAEWYVDDPKLADVREEDGRAVVHAKAAGTIRITAILRGEKRTRDIKVWPADQELPPGTSTWGTHPIGRELGDIPAVPTPDAPTIFTLEQTPAGKTHLRGIRDDGIQVWNWLMPEDTRDVELVCGDWLGGALISANRADSYTLYTVEKDGSLRWRHDFAGKRKAHAYNLEHVVHILSQSSDGFATKLTALDEKSGDLKFELTIPASEERLVNLRRAGSKFVCETATGTSPKRTDVSTLLINSDGLAYLAFTQNSRTLTAPGCAAGSSLEARDVTLTRDDRATLWQIQPDGKYRATDVEAAKGEAGFSEPLIESAPTGAIIPDGLEGVLVSMRRTRTAGPSSRPEAEEFVYRLDPDGKLMYRFLLPRYQGKLHDGMVLGEENFGFATRGGTLIAFDVQAGTEKWRWNSSEDVEVFVALKNGACVIQTPTALVQVNGPSSSKELMKGKFMLGWHGDMYQKHN
jgi:outer membrane protein assembly factor BamB